MALVNRRNGDDPRFVEAWVQQRPVVTLIEHSSGPLLFYQRIGVVTFIRRCANHPVEPARTAGSRRICVGRTDWLTPHGNPPLANGLSRESIGTEYAVHEIRGFLGGPWPKPHEPHVIFFPTLLLHRGLYSRRLARARHFASRRNTNWYPQCCILVCVRAVVFNHIVISRTAVIG